MNKAIIAIVLALGFSTAACGSSEQPVATKTVTASPTLDSTSTEEKFADLVQRETDFFDGYGVSDLYTLASAVCTGFDNDKSFAEQATVLLDEGASPHDTGFFIGAAIGAYCPEYESKIDEVTSSGT